MFCWGNNQFGQLGDGTTTSRATPVAVAGLSQVTAVAANAGYTCALTTDGTVHCWGRWPGSTTNGLTPVAVPGLSGVTAISAGPYSACAVTGLGTVLCWPTTTSATPVTVPGLSGVTAVATGYLHACALTGAGLVRCWGNNGFGQLGDGTRTSSATPVTVVGLSGATAVTAGHLHTCALLGNGTARCWGYDAYGELGDGTTTYRLTPVQVLGLSGLGSIASGGWDHTCAVTRGGTGYCWGMDETGQLGNGTADHYAHPVPVVVSGLAGAAAISPGSGHTCGVTVAHTVHCWGYNTSGQLGNGTLTSRTIPVATLGLTSRVWDRLAGADRYATAAAVSRSSFPDGGAGAVVLARGDAYPDALVGVPLAAARHAPLLLTHGTTLPTATLTEIRRVLPVGSTVYLLGGTDVVPASIGTQLVSLGYQVSRYAGVDRFATAVAVADALGDPSTVLLASGLDFPDALAAGPAATAVHGAVLQSAGSTLPPVTAAYLAAHPGTSYAIGGPAAAAYPTAQPVLGADRYGTAATVVATFFPAPITVGIATGLNFPDALAGAAQLATTGGPLLLTSTTVLPAASVNALTAAKASITTTHFYGEIDVVADPVALSTATALGY